MKIVWTGPALNDLDEMGSFISQDSPVRAQTFIAEIFESVEKLMDFPHAGRKFPEIRREDLRELIYEGYRIVYQVIGTQIIVLTVAEGHKLLHLKNIRSRRSGR